MRTIALGFSLLLGLGLGASACDAKQDQSNPPPSNDGQQACSTEARVCPDGSGVGRTGPNCEFAPCPEPDSGPEPEPNPDDEVACTMDAKICPDGSGVGRVAPDCEFAPCPGE